MGKFVDLTGRVFGRWTVLHRIANTKQRKAAYLCRCSCEKHTERIVGAYKLRSGKSKSCNCLKKSKDLTGQIFGRWTVLRRVANKGHGFAYLCRCSCEKHTKKVVRATDLRIGQSTNCGCLTKKLMGKFVDLTGKVFGRWTVLHRVADTKYREAVYLCRCSCEKHTEMVVGAYKLRSGKSQDCGCLPRRRRFTDLTGHIFGRWTVLHRVANTKHRTAAYLCCCSCEKHTKRVVSAANLRNGVSQDCGCLPRIRRFPDLTGQTIGNWFVVKYVGKGTNKWLCRCTINPEIERFIYGSKLRRREGVSDCAHCIKIPCPHAYQSAFSKLLYAYQYSARKKNRSWEITPEHFYALIQSACDYCGCMPQCKKSDVRGNELAYNGLDRVDSNKGYTLDNVVPCCKVCNRMKGNLSRQEFLAHIEQIHTYQQRKKQNGEVTVAPIDIGKTWIGGVQLPLPQFFSVYGGL